MLAAIAVALVMVIVIRLNLGPRERMSTALRATARWSFVLFWLATAGPPLSTLLGARFKPLARQARNLGLSYASAHLVHLGLVVWMYLTSTPQLGRNVFVVFGIGVFWTYLLAALSFETVSAAVGVHATRILRLIGVEYIAFVFFIDFNKNPLGGRFARVLDYAPFVALAAAGPLLRLAAFAKRHRQKIATA